MKKYHSFKQIDQELEALNKEAQQNMEVIKANYGDIKSTLKNITTFGGILREFIRNKAVAQIISRIRRKKES